MLTYFSAAIFFILVIFLVDRCYRVFSLRKKIDSLNKKITHVKSNQRHFVESIEKANTSTHDSQDFLTNLVNEQYFENHFSHLLHEAKRFDSLFAVMLINIDEFNKINQEYSYEAGDKILIQMANCLKKNIRQIDTAGRHAETFTILFPGVTSSEVIVYAAQRLLDSIATTAFLIDDKKINITVGIGIAVYPYDGNDKKTLLLHAKKALSIAKKNGKNLFQFYQKETQALGKNQINLKKFIQSKDFLANVALEYQNYYNVVTNKIVCTEVLVWFNHPSTGKIHLSKFIEITKNVAKLFELVEWVIHAGVTRFQNTPTNKQPQFLKFKFPLRQIENFSFVTKIIDTFNDLNINPHQVIIEFSDEVEDLNIDLLKQSIERLSERGFNIATGVLLLGHLAMKKLTNLPVNFLYLSNDFIKDLNTHTENRNILEKILTLANVLEIGVLCSGVEKEEQKKFLADLGCYVMQGHLLEKNATESMLS